MNVDSVIVGIYGVSLWGPIHRKEGPMSNIDGIAVIILRRAHQKVCQFSAKPKRPYAKAQANMNKKKIWRSFSYFISSKFVLAEAVG